MSIPISCATVEALKRARFTLACAESCTGGLVAKMITDVAGSSEVFEGGVVSYSNEFKMTFLGVLPETLARYGAVSENTAREMARGVAHRSGADIAVSTTGIAGPGGGTLEKPVGTVCFGIVSPRGEETFTMHFGEELSRDEVRYKAAEFALSLVLKECDGCSK